MIKYFYCCSFCGRPLWQISFVCESCLFIPELKVRWQGNIKHYYLYEYDEYSSVFVKNFKYGYFSNLVDKISFRFLSTEEGEIVALPNSKNTVGSDNHSYVLAKSIFKTREIREPLCKESGKQALRNKTLRDRVSLRQTQVVNVDKPVIFVDDLVTSGKTLEAAVDLLRAPSSSLIFSLSYTPKTR